MKTTETGLQRKGRSSVSSRIFDICNYLFFALFTLLCVYPFYYIFINTISDNTLTARGLVLFYPEGIHFSNYTQVMKLQGLGEATLISIARTVLGTFLSVFASAFVGYLVTKQKLWHRKIWYRIIVATMYFNAGIIPWYILMMNLHLTNNFLAYIIPGIMSPFNIILVKTYVESIPPALEESAQIDSAGYWVRFTRIVLPLCLPILATVTVFTAVGQWNSFQDTLFLMTDRKLYTLQFLLYRYINESNALATVLKNTGGNVNINLSLVQTPTSVRMTVTMIVVAPILLVYPFFQRYFVGGIMIGAVKG
ncbi:MAG: carbohydrate ABC transporter permease [Clostridia bacterium]|nr:carbohydrate ABC transporter permease [Clostridia bacterium]